MLSAEDNELLTRTGAETPMGRYFRRFWQPVALSEELPARDGAPIRVRIMGEDLVAFRDSEGRIGLFDRRCPHRGADMYFGRNEACGLRCVYHGWKFDVTGKAVDLPNVPPGARHHDTVRIQSYPTREYGDIVWAWMGPPERMPAPPELEYGLMPAGRRYVMKQLIECNWAQVLEGDLDTSHFSFLHMPAPSVPSNENPDAPADARRLRWIRNDPMPRFQILDHEVGFVVGGARKADEEGIYWRMTQFMLPAHGTGPSTLPGETYFGFTVAPITDEACWIYVYAWNPEREIGPEERAKLKKGHGVIAEVGPDYIPLRNRGNDFQIDRQAQKSATFTGIKGLAEQDLMIQQSQGFIADRTRETLTATDAAVARFRRTLLAGAKALMAGEEPTAPWRPEAYRTRPGSWFAAEGIDFEDVLLERFGDRRGRVQAAE
ncbi:Rieske 2Fe-2S domain-containing protein [Desertibaculum subflavum]|uniref:Rieske 2Fe-2S domain-containing protein n=1 Tax=Desertibaculum subflavum TaxID=2268458 RepID=UPI000E668328